MTGRPVVAGVDGSDTALEAVRFAAREAALRGVGLRLVEAFTVPTTLHAGNPAVMARYRRVMQGLARCAMDTAVAAATTHEPTVPVEAEIRTGQPIPILLDEARAACLLVLGSRGLGGFSGLLLGSVAVAASARAQCPVAVVRELGEAAPDSPKPVVVGVDRSAGSEAALVFAFDAAQARGVPLEVVYAAVDSALHPDTVPALDWSSVEAEERSRLDEWLAGWSEKYRQVPTQTIVTRDNPGRALVERSARAQLVVVGSRGRGGFAGLLLGSVSQALLHHAHCPVVVARRQE